MKKFEQKEPLLSFIVPVYKIKEDTFKRCLMSLDNQDYPNIEVIVAFDGPDPKLEKVFHQFYMKHDPKFWKFWQKTVIPHGGACAARNAGFKESTGEVVSFFNSDYILNPGMARFWIDELMAHPEAGFVYGAYGYFGSRAMYPAKPFDQYLLDTANYIDCGFPLWRKHVVEWDPKIKSLQDWDFWLGVTHKGVKGHYLGEEISFLAEPPRAGGLSMDSSDNWVERVRTVKKKHGIKESDLLVTSIGAPNHGIEIAKVLGADYRDDTIFKPHEYKGLYMIGWFMKPNDRGNQHPQIMGAMPKGMKKIIHFIGADIYWLRKFPWDSLKLLAETLNNSVDYVLCESEQSRRELEQFGIRAKIVPIPPYQKMEVRPVPADFKVAVMMTDRSNFDKYMREHTLSIIRAMPDVQFVSYGDGAGDINYPNLFNLGQIPRSEYVKMVYECSALLRLVKHDTVPMSMCEFLMAGRDVITNVDSPFVKHIDTAGRETINEWDKFEPGFNESRWPDTKADIVQKIRDTKLASKTYSKEYRNSVAEQYCVVYSIDKYRASIDELFEVKSKIPLQVVRGDK